MRLVAWLGLLLACGNAAPRTQTAVAAPLASSSAPDESFREKAPELGPAQPFFVPQLTEKRLPNGVRLLSAQLDGSGIGVLISMPGVTSFSTQPAGMLTWLARSLFGATPTRDSTAIHRTLEDAPAVWGVRPTVEMIEISIRTTKKARVEDCIDVVADVLQNNLLSETDFVFQLAPLVQVARTWTEDPTYVALTTLSKLQYGETNPLASTLVSGLERNPKYDPKGMRALFDAVVRPDQVTVLAIGAIDDRILGKLESAFGGLHKRPSRITATAVPPATPKLPMPPLVVIDRPGAAQSHLAVGAMGPGHEAEDWPAWALARDVVGSSPTSRIQRALLEQGTVAGAETNMYTHHGVSLFAFEGSVPTARTAQMLVEVRKQLAKMREEDVSSAELDAAKASFLDGIPEALETTAGALGTFATIVEDGLPLDYFTQIFPKVRAITPADVRKIARARLAPELVSAVIVGDWKVLEPQLKALGPVEVRKP